MILSLNVVIINSYSPVKRTIQPNVFVTLSPNQSDFKNFFRDLIAKYEEAAGKIQTLLHEPHFKVFCDTPLYEMTQTQRNLLNIGINEYDEVKRPWPEVEFLFGEDENYQEIVSEIMQNVTASITKVTKYIEVFLSFFDFL
jgi:hypothetical protein